jgi:hypothetical protein
MHLVMQYNVQSQVVEIKRLLNSKIINILSQLFCKECGTIFGVCVASGKSIYG